MLDHSLACSTSGPSSRPEHLLILPGTRSEANPHDLLAAPDSIPLNAPPVRIRVVGVGGAGGNVVDRLWAERLPGIDTLAVNTDRQALRAGRATRRLVIGATLTRGLGAGGNPGTGQGAAEESATLLNDGLRGADLVFIAAGMGGGTGTGAAPVVAGLARDLGALTVALVTRPFAFEGRHRALVADQGIAQLRAIADTVIVIPNDRLLQAAARTTTVREAFGMADSVLRHGVQGIADMMTRHGLINVDFADVRAIMDAAGPALLGIGVGRGPDRVVEAARRAMACPLLEGRLEGASRLLLNITGGEDLGLLEVQRAAELVGRTVDADANIIFGAVIDPAFTSGQVKLTLVAAGFAHDGTASQRRRFAVARPQSTEQAEPGDTEARAAPPSLPPGVSTWVPRRPPPDPGATPAGPEAARAIADSEFLDIPPFLMRFRGRKS